MNCVKNKQTKKQVQAIRHLVVGGGGGVYIIMYIIITVTLSNSTRDEYS